MEHKYKIKYKVEYGDFAKEDIPAGSGACDKMLVCQILTYPGLGQAFCWGGHNAVAGKELTPGEMFDCWMSLTESMVNDVQLGEELKNALKATHSRMKHFQQRRPNGQSSGS